MKKTYLTPTVEELKISTEHLIAASGLDTNELLDMEVDGAWSRDDSFILTDSYAK